MSYGREKIRTDAVEITAANVADEVRKAYAVHCVNRTDTQRLWDYYRGKTAVLRKTKEVRPEINHKINENRCFEVVGFHKGYVFGEPIQYIRRENSVSEANDDAIAADINALNSYMADANKAAHDASLAEWLYVAGTSYRMGLPNPKWMDGGDEPPFVVYTLDPRDTFVVYGNSIGEPPLMAVKVVQQESIGKVFFVYTEKSSFEFEEFGSVVETPHTLGMIPIIEYPADNARLGVFEIALPLLDALDELQSNRMDDIVQTVNSFLAIFGAEMDKEAHDKLEEWKMMFLPEGTDARFLTASMKQADLQALKDDLYQSILTICGVPNRNGGSSTSDTGTAVIYRDGYATADARARATELMFKSSEKQFLKLILRILRDTVGTGLKSTDIETHFTRRNYENIAAKSQVLISMLNNPKIHPELAFAYSGMFVDPESAYLQSKKWTEEQEAKNRANTGTDPVSAVQQAAGGSEGTGTDPVS